MYPMLLCDLICETNFLRDQKQHTKTETEFNETHKRHQIFMIILCSEQFITLARIGG